MVLFSFRSLRLLCVELPLLPGSSVSEPACFPLALMVWSDAEYATFLLVILCALSSSASLPAPSIPHGSELPRLLPSCCSCSCRLPLSLLALSLLVIVCPPPMRCLALTLSLSSSLQLLPPPPTPLLSLQLHSTLPPLILIMPPSLTPPLSRFLGLPSPAKLISATQLQQMHYLLSAGHSELLFVVPLHLIIHPRSSAPVKGQTPIGSRLLCS